MLIMKPNWNPRLSDVLGHQTVEEQRVSARTGNRYTVDVIKQLKVYSTGSVELHTNSKGEIEYRYSIVDPSRNKGTLEYTITAPQKLDVSFGQILSFTDVVGGATSSGGWYKATSVKLLKKE